MTLPALTPEDIYTLRNKAPPIADTLREVQDYYDNIDEYTDDEDWLEHPNNQENLENGALLSSKKRDFECLMGDEINSDDDDDYKDVSTFPATSLLPPPSVDSAEYPQKGLCNWVYLYYITLTINNHHTAANNIPVDEKEFCICSSPYAGEEMINMVVALIRTLMVGSIPFV